MCCLRFTLHLVAASSLLVGTYVRAQDSPGGPTLRAPRLSTVRVDSNIAPIPERQESTTVQHAKLQHQIRVAQNKLKEQQADQTATEKPKKSKETSRELELLKQQDDLLSQQHTLAERTKQLEGEKTTVDEELKRVKSEGIEEEPPFSFLLLERLESSVATQSERTEAAKNSVDSAKENLSRAKEVAKEKEVERINTKEAFEANKDAAALADLMAAQKIAEIESQNCHGESRSTPTGTKERSTGKRDRPAKARNP